MITKICKQCGKEFEILLTKTKQGCGKFCSRKCFAQFRQGIKRPQFSGKNHPNWKKKIKIKCLFCKKEFEVSFSQKNKKFCSIKCCNKWKKGKPNERKGEKRPQCFGKNHHNWKGGKIKNNGYIYFLKPNHPFHDKKGYIAKHRLIAEKCLGRYLTKLEIIHHIGIKYPMGSIKNKQDNQPKNLYLFATLKEHNLYHHLKNKPILISNLKKIEGKLLI